MLNFVGNIIGKNSASFIADFFAVFYKMFSVSFINKVKTIFAAIINVIAKYIWFVCKWILGIIDVMQLAFTRLIGIDTEGTTLSLGDYIEGMKDISTTTGSDYYSYLLKIFRAVFAVAIVLMIIFTIYAMVMQEYKLATDGYSKADNDKGKFFKILFKNVIVIFLMPLIFYTLIVGTNSILSAFYRAVGNEPDTTIAGNVLAASTYDANRYRAYANADKRIPITISVYSTENAFGKTAGDDEILNELRKDDVQTKLKVIAGAFANDSFLPFEKSTVNKNGTLSSYQNYSLIYNNEVYEDMGQYFENFICTREQYYVMADFVDFCQRYNIKYYIKAMSEADICWKYVDGITANPEIDEEGNALGDITLNVTYRNAESINNPTGSVITNDTYKLQITTKLDMTSPISDALTTASKLLGIDENSSKYNTMERDDSGDYVNLVEWSTRKAKLKLSQRFDLTNPETWTATDQIIVYEYYRFENNYGSTNNTLEDYTLQQIKDSGAFLDALEMTYRNYNSNTQTYSDAKTQYCVKINGHFYRLKESETEVDDYGHAYFELDVVDANVDYFTETLVSITKTSETHTLQLSSGFNINERNTWTVRDQVLIYEFCKNLSVSDRTLSEEMVINHMFEDFKTGVAFDIYKINSVNYINLNGTYYQVSGLTSNSTGVFNTTYGFLMDTQTAGQRWFGYKLSVAEREKYGISDLSLKNVVGTVVGTVVEVNDSDAMYQKYSALKFKLSDNFSLSSTEEWTYRDYALISLYISTNLSEDSAVTVESLKSVGLVGDIVRSGGDYYLRITGTKSTGAEYTLYINLANLEKTSELTIMSTLNEDMFESMSLNSTGVDLMTSYNASLSTDILLNSSVSTHTFYMSENFDRYDATTWTNGDFLIIYLIETGVIDVDYSMIQYKGYTSLVYNVKANNDTEAENYYRFGKLTKTADGSTTTTDANAYFLNEYELEKLGYTVDKWFSANFMSYMLLMKYDCDLSDLIISETDFGGGVDEGQDAYVFDLTDDASSKNSLQYILGKDLLSQGSITTDDDKFKYSYYNPGLIESDLSTWTYLDLLIFTKTGTLPTKTTPFVSSLISVKDLSNTNIYILVDDLLVNINDGVFECYDIKSNLISSDSINTFTSSIELSNHYNKYLANAIRNNLNEDLDAGITGGTQAHKRFVYYSSVLQGTGNASFEAGKAYSAMDIILVENKVSMNADGYYIFEIYSYNGELYAEITNTIYVCLSTNESARIYYIENSLVIQTKAFSAPTEVYTSFKSTDGLTKLDAVIYASLGTKISKDYKCYTLNNNDNNKYIRLENGKILELDAEYNDDEYKYADLQGDKNDYYQYYMGYVTSTFDSSSIKKTYTGVSITGPSCDGKTALGLILENSYADLATSTLIETISGTYYLKTLNSDYVSLDGLVSVSFGYDTNSEIKNITLTDIAQDSFLLNVKKITENTFRVTHTLFNNNNYSSYIKDDAIIDGTTIIGKHYEIGNHRDEGVTGLTTFTTAGLISKYLDPNENYLDKFGEEQVFTIYYNIEDGKNYIGFNSIDKTYYVPLYLYGSDKTIFDKIYNNNSTAPEGNYLNYAEFEAGDIISKSQLDNIFKKQGFSGLSGKYSAVWNDSDNYKNIEFYIASNSLDYLYCIYGASNTATEGVTLKYWGIIERAGNLTTSEKDDIADAAIFKLETRSMSEIAKWSMYDFVVSYATGSTLPNFISSKVYIIKNPGETKYKYYIKTDDYYLMIFSSKSPLSSPGVSITTATSGIISNDLESTLFNNFACLNSGSVDYELNSLFKYSSYGNYSDTAANSDVFAKFVKNSLKEATSGKLTRFNFSSTFKVEDYSSWQISDYVLYHLIINGDYGTSNFFTQFTFNYYPSYSFSNDKYYNLTYLDRVLYHKIGLQTGAASTGEPLACTLVRDSSYQYYIYYDGIYIPLSDKVTMNFADMTIESASLGKIYTIEEFKDEAGTMGGDPGLKVKEGEDFKTSISGKTNYLVEFDSKNFQTFVNATGVPGYVFYLYKEDPDTGSVECDKVIRFATSDKQMATGDCYKYDKLFSFYDKALSTYIETTKINDLTVDIKTGTTKPSGYDLALEYVYNDIHADFEFEDYYYYLLDATKLTTSKLTTIGKSIQDSIKNDTFTGDVKDINLRLSNDCVLSDTGTWTYLDYIILYEMSRDIRHNAFKGSTFIELKESDYCLPYLYVDGEFKYLQINNNIYDLSEIVEYDSSNDYYKGKNVKTLNSVNVSTIAKAGSVNNYDFKVLNEVKSISINPSFTTGTSPKAAHYSSEGKNTISYTTKNGETINYKYIDTNVAETNYRIKTSDYAIYTTTTIIKNVSWVEKLMTDMQVYYPDLNWGVLIATDGWIDTLGEFVSAYNNGLYIGGDNSANTTAAGLVLSEFFMSVATPVSDSYANYEYSSVFDEDTIRALMLSLVGEESYQALVFEAKVFMDYFNSCFAPIIDDFAEEFGEDIGNNSLRLNAYKSYLATLLLSSDIGEYLYTVATRVYAEYTICEYLAAAAGDYSGYYSYINNLTDEEGNAIESYTFGTFKELVQYENEYCGNANPTFTFNFKKAFEKYQDDDGEILGKKYDDVVASNYYYNAVIGSIMDELDKEYSGIYKNGYQISEKGKVIDEKGREVEGYDEEYIYCYMLHVYYSILNSINGGTPVYLDFYRDYIDGTLTRWSIICDDNIENADKYYEDYNKDKTKLKIYKLLSTTTSLRLFLPSLVMDIDDDDESSGLISIFSSVIDIVKSVITGDFDNISGIFSDALGTAGDAILSIRPVLPMIDARYLMEGNSSLEDDIDYLIKNTIALYFRMNFSEDSGSTIVEGLKNIVDSLLPADLSTETSWNAINTYYECLTRVIDELVEIRNTLPGGKTENGLDREHWFGSGNYYTDYQLDKIIGSFQDLEYNLDQYITAQTRIDQMQKRSITFTLAQFGSNYVSTGYEFSVKNKTYTFKTSTDPVRLAEYVYGGSFLESVGVGAQYTDPEFTGIIKASKVYDPADKTLKTNLDSWLELRTFLSEIADKTAELYYLTNLKDLDINTKNAIYLNDSITISGTYSVDSIEDALSSYIITGLSNEVKNRITEGKTGHEKFVALSQYIFLNSVKDEEFDKMTLEDYKRIVIKQLIENRQNGEESADERAARYMILFNLLSVQVEFYSDGTALGRIISNGKIESRTGDKVIIKSYASDSQNNSEVELYAGSSNFTGVFSLSNSTLETVKTLSGLENRPTAEILTREYSGLRTADYFDESFGDTFIACIFNEADGLYYPVLGSGSKNCNDEKYKSYFENIDGNKEGKGWSVQKHKFVSEYYDTSSNLVVCKGVVTADGYPTAIRKYNNPLEIEQKRLLSSKTTLYNAVTYYRTNVGANFGEGEDLIDASRAVSRVTTKNYTKYVYGTSYTKGIGSSVTYTGKTNLKTIVSSDYQSFYVQSKAEYLITQADDFGGISVLDEFSYYYVFSGQTWILLVLAFITVIPVMINAVGGAATRIFDLIILFLASPLVMSTNSLYADGKNKTYDAWKKNIESVLLGVFGYIIGFSFFSIMVPMIYNINTFVTVDTYKKIQSIAGLGSFVSYPTINSLARSLWLITAVSILERIPKLLLPIITANYGDLSSPHPGLGPENRSFTEKVKDVKGSMDDAVSKIGSVVSGRALMGLMNEVKTDMVNMIPGSALIQEGKKIFIDPMVNKAKDAANKAAGAALEKMLVAQGVPPDLAKKAVKTAMEEKKKAEEAKKKQKERMQKYQQEFRKNFM